MIPDTMTRVVRGHIADGKWQDEEVIWSTDESFYTSIPDIAEFLPATTRLGVRAAVTAYPLEEANRALLELRSGKVRGAKVLVVGS